MSKISYRASMMAEMRFRGVDWDEQFHIINNAFQGHDEDEKEDIALDLICMIRKKYPLPSKQEFLDHWETKHDWRDMKDRYSAHWGSVDSLLTDAIETKHMAIVALLAPLFVFQSDKAKFFPNKRIDPAILPLFGEQNIKPLHIYQSMPYCIRSEGLEHGELNLQESHELVGYSEILRQVGCDRVLSHYMHRYDMTEEELAEILEDDPQFDFYRAMSDMHNTAMKPMNGRFERMPFNRVCGADEMGRPDMMNLHRIGFLYCLRMTGWDIHFDGESNLFGTAQYAYVTSVRPGHDIGYGAVFSNGIKGEPPVD